MLNSASMGLTSLFWIAPLATSVAAAVLAVYLARTNWFDIS
jgi:hypothetical protein